MEPKTGASTLCTDGDGPTASSARTVAMVGAANATFDGSIRFSATSTTPWRGYLPCGSAQVCPTIPLGVRVSVQSPIRPAPDIIPRLVYVGAANAADARKTSQVTSSLRGSQEKENAATNLSSTRQFALHRAASCIRRASRVIASCCEFRILLGMCIDAKGVCPAVCVLLIRVRRTHTRRLARRALHSRGHEPSHKRFMQHSDLQ